MNIHIFLLKLHECYRVSVAGLSSINVLILRFRLQKKPPSGLCYLHGKEQKHKMNCATHVKLLLRSGVCHIQSLHGPRQVTGRADSGARKDSPLWKSAASHRAKAWSVTLRRRELILELNSAICHRYLSRCFFVW